MGIGCAVLLCLRVGKMREAVARETAKYSQATPIPCSWRVKEQRSYYRGYGLHHNFHNRGSGRVIISYEVSAKIFGDVLIVVLLST